MINEPEDNLKGMLGKGSFAVPENYFEQLNRDIQTRLVEERLKALAVSPGFTVPESYFEQLKGDVQTQLIEEKLTALTVSPGFTVPELYFEQLSSRIEVASKPSAALPPVARVVKLWRSDILKYATAACFILLTAFGFYINNNAVNKPNVATEMANEQILLDTDEQLTTESIVSKPAIDVNTRLSEEELETYILNNFSTNDIAANY
jgi:hypothetical protein